MMGSVAKGVSEQINCTSRQLTTATDMAPGSLTSGDGDVMRTVSRTIVTQLAGTSNTTP